LKIFAQTIAIFGAFALVYLAYLSWPEIRYAIRLSEPQPITAEVRLNNRCPLKDTDFVVRQTKTSRTATFSNGVARISVLEGDYVELQLNARYGEVRFNGIRQRASQSMTLTADCGMGERMQGTLDSMRGKFGG